MSEPTVGAGFARGLLELAVRKGARRQDLLARSGIEASALCDQDRRIPFSSYMALMRAGQAHDPALGLHYGAEVQIADVSIVGLIGQASPNMAEALAQLNRYVPLVVETENAGGGVRFQFTQDATGLWLVDTRINPNSFPELTESAFAQLISTPRRRDFERFVTAVHVTHAAPAYGDEYARVFGAPVVFESGRNALQIDPARLSDRVDLLPSYVFGVLSAHAEALLQELQSTKTMRGRVESQLMLELHTGQASAARIAARLGVSRPTLYRRLRAEGVTFEALLDALRHKLALHYLEGRKVSINEAAYLVGYSDPAAFSRAFKRWTGISPGSMRSRS